MINVDSGIPIPKTIQLPRAHKYPYGEMKKGDSFFVECTAPEQKNRQCNLLTNAKAWCTRNKKKFKFVSRFVEGGVRIWRIS